MNVLVSTVVGEAHEGELVANKGLWCGEGLLLPAVLLDVVKVAGVDVAAELRHHGRRRCRDEHKQRKRIEAFHYTLMWAGSKQEHGSSRVIILFFFMLIIIISFPFYQQGRNLFLRSPASYRLQLSG